jgi:glc operon protein GlcG
MRVSGRVAGLAAWTAVALTTSPTVLPAQTIDKKVLSFAAARKMAAAAQVAAKGKGVDVVIVVVDDAGYIILLERMDGAQVASVNVGIGKARTAAIYRRPSKVFEDQVRNGRVAALALADATPLQGGIPVLLDGQVIGAIGVSGDTPQVDEDIAIVGAKAFP